MEFFFHPMLGDYSCTKDLEIQRQIGNKMIPEYPIKSIAEAHYQLKKHQELPGQPFIALAQRINNIWVIML